MCAPLGLSGEIERELGDMTGHIAAVLPAIVVSIVVHLTHGCDQYLFDDLG